MKCSSKMLQNLPYLKKTKIYIYQVPSICFVCIKFFSHIMWDCSVKSNLSKALVSVHFWYQEKKLHYTEVLPNPH